MSRKRTCWVVFCFGSKRDEVVEIWETEAEARARVKDLNTLYTRRLYWAEHMSADLGRCIGEKGG